MAETEPDKHPDVGLKEKITGLGQVIIGEVETIGGVLTADPITQAEGEFNVEVGTIREDLEETDAELDTNDQPVESSR
jgi:hypothetical protein